jgi:hypothetical protein
LQPTAKNVLNPSNITKYKFSIKFIDLHIKRATP